MGHKSKKNENLSIEHYKTELFIHKTNICSECPLRIYAKKDENIILGVGNIMSDTIIILPSYDVKAQIGYNTILKIVQDIYKDIYGKELLEEYYVTRSIKCINKTDFNLEKDAIRFCITNLFYEVFRIRPKKIIIFDKQIYDFGLYNINKGKFVVRTVINPGVMYYNNENLKNMFIKQFKEAIYDSDT